MTPKPRKPGQTGGWMGHKHNQAASRARGGSPRAGGGGGSKGGCCLALIAFLSGFAVFAYATWEHFA